MKERNFPSNEKSKKSLNFNELRNIRANQPKRKFLWNGIKEKSFGLVFGPAKSGKTILCENLAISVAIGSKEYLGYSISEGPKKVLFVGLEEYWEDRFDRNLKQINALNEEETKLFEQNFFYPPIDFKDKIVTSEDWNNLKELILETEAEVIFIDSITRMNYGKLEDGAVAEKIMQNLRRLCHECGVTIIAIHHTRKLNDEPITMDSLKGSSAFAQECDFAIGVRNTNKNHKYLKNIVFRYASCNDEFVKEIEMDDDIWLNVINESDEDEILRRTDRRRTDNKRDLISKYINENSSLTYKTTDLINRFTLSLSIKPRQVQTYLSDLVNENKVRSPKRGIYTSINYSDNPNTDTNV